MACVYKRNSKVVGQKMTNDGKPIYQVVAVTSDEALAREAKDELLEEGFSDASEEIKQFGKQEWAVCIGTDKWIDINGEISSIPDEVQFLNKKDAEVLAKKVGGEAVKLFSDSANYISSAYPIKAGVVIQDFYIFGAENVQKYDYEDKQVNIPSEITIYLEKRNCKDISVELVSETETEIKYKAKFVDTNTKQFSNYDLLKGRKPPKKKQKIIFSPWEPWRRVIEGYNLEVFDDGDLEVGDYILCPEVSDRPVQITETDKNYFYIDSEGFEWYDDSNYGIREEDYNKLDLKKAESYQRVKAGPDFDRD